MTPDASLKPPDFPPSTFRLRLPLPASRLLPTALASSPSLANIPPLCPRPRSHCGLPNSGLPIPQILPSAIMKKTTVLLTLMLAASAFAQSTNAIQPVPAFAQARIAAIQVLVSPDRPDWTCAVGEKVKFTITVLADNLPLKDAVVSFKIGPEQMPASIGKDKVPIPATGLVIDAGTLSHPGFLRCTAATTIAGKNYKGAATIAFSPEKIQPTQTNPDDFDAFWDAARADLAKIPVEAIRTLLPEHCTDTVNVYHVAIHNIRMPPHPSRIHGILCEPKTPGKYPAVLRVPGAGVRGYLPASVDAAFAARGFITLTIGIHGIPVNMPASVYQSLAAILSNYNSINLDNRDTYYYRRVYLGCVRANDYLVSLPNWDGKNLLVTGGSQGGQLSVVTAGLDHRVTALAPIYPAYCDVTGYLHGRAGGWPHMFRADPKTGESFHAKNPAKIATTAYYDTVNFARRVKAPGLYTWGYNDETCPPTSLFAAYNVITAPKSLNLALITGHNTLPEEHAAIEEWLVAQAK
ncbi:MAG: acetylxylan esterase [Opitutaceae bacterium]|nr:acetylxylan esterase [Opitutaceae bacterium]